MRLPGKFHAAWHEVFGVLTKEEILDFLEFLYEKQEISASELFKVIPCLPNAKKGENLLKKKIWDGIIVPDFYKKRLIKIFKKVHGLKETREFVEFILRPGKITKKKIKKLRKEVMAYK